MKILILGFLCWLPITAIVLALWHAFITSNRNDQDP